MHAGRHSRHYVSVLETVLSRTSIFEAFAILSHRSTMPVKYLELENFKSYGGHSIIGPFKDFTSVVGPNGSGKSNLMDAISFVFGVQSRDLRSTHLKDLIFRPPGNNNNKQQRLRASATLVFETDEGEEIRYSRTISAAGVGEYQVNGRTVGFAEYETKLQEIGVLIKARNFLVFQGDVESLARKSPTELVALIEQISGSSALQAEYDEAASAKEAAEQETLFAFKKQKTLRSERRFLKDQKEEAERFDALLTAKAKLQTDLYLWLLYHIDQDRTEREATAKTLKEELQAHDEEEKQVAARLKQAKKAASAARRHTAQADKSRVQLAASVDQLEPSIIQTTEEINNLRKKLQQDEKQLKKKQQEVEVHDDKLQGLETEIAEYKQTQQDLEADYEEIKRNATGDDVQLTPEQEVEYERVREAAAAAGAEPRRRLATLNRRLETARSKAAGLAQDLAESKKTEVETASDVKDFRDREEKLTKVSPPDN